MVHKNYWLEKWKEKRCTIHDCPVVECCECVYDYDIIITEFLTMEEMSEYDTGRAKRI